MSSMCFELILLSYGMPPIHHYEPTEEPAWMVSFRFWAAKVLIINGMAKHFRDNLPAFKINE